MLSGELMDLTGFYLRLKITDMLKEPFNLICNFIGHQIDYEKHIQILQHIDYIKLSDGFKYKLSHDNCRRCTAYLDIIIYPEWPKKLFIMKH